MPTGRIIFPYSVTIARLDTAATAADPDAAGPLESGFDDDFRETVIVPPTDAASSERGTDARVDSVVTLPAQVEEGTFEALEMMATGRTPGSLVRLVFHYNDLESNGLIGAANNDVQLRINDRLDEIATYPGGEVLHKIPASPGLFATQVQPRSFGLGGGKVNLFLVTFQERELSVRA